MLLYLFLYFIPPCVRLTVKITSWSVVDSYTLGTIIIPKVIQPFFNTLSLPFTTHPYNLLKNGPSSTSFCLFLSFQTNITILKKNNITILKTNKCEKVSIQYMVPWFEPTTFGHVCLPITTTPGLPPYYLFLFIPMYAFVNFLCLCFHILVCPCYCLFIQHLSVHVSYYLQLTDRGILALSFRNVSFSIRSPVGTML